MLNGFLVVDKPAGVTSHDVVAILRRTCRQKKIGHTGTLDPFATGVLPLALGEGTKAIHYLDESVKEYRAVMRLGISTDTQDLTGRVLRERDWRHLTPDSIKGLVPAFCGDITQIPPMYSALKRDGVPLYKLARKGESVERESRPVRIHSLIIDRIELPDVFFTVKCSRGTYVRTLADDMGERLGVGAHLLELRRTASGPFTISAAVPLAELSAATPEEIATKYLLSIKTALSQLPEIEITAASSGRVMNGIAPRVEDLLCTLSELPASGNVMLCCEGVIVALAKIIAVAERKDDGVLQLARVFNQLYPLH